MERRVFLQDTAATAVALALPGRALKAEPDLTPVFAQVEKRHDEAVQRLQQWIRQPSIAAENRGVQEGCELTMQMLREAGFGEVAKVPTDGQPGIFATLDAGAPRTLGLYFMYDVKQADPAEWTSPPWVAALVDKPGLGKAVVGRGAVNQKGPEAAFLAALHAIRGEKRGLGSLLVHGPSADHGLSESGFVDERRHPGWRGPLGRVRLLHVVHEVQGKRARRAGVERCEDPRLAVARQLGDLPE